MPAVAYLGGTVAVSAATPATIDSAGFAALTWTTVNFVVQWGEVGDTSEDIAIQLLNGRTEHLNGARDGGEIAFTFRNEAPTADPGQNILIANNNANTNVSIRHTDPDGRITYYLGLVANLRDLERTSTSYKGMSGVIRVNSATVRT